MLTLIKIIKKEEILFFSYRILKGDRIEVNRFPGKYSDEKFSFASTLTILIKKIFKSKKFLQSSMDSKEAQEVIGKNEKKSHHFSSVIVWWELIYDGNTKLYFHDKRVITWAKNYHYVNLGSVIKILHFLSH